MANSDKNIVITPNTGTSSYPAISFTGSNASPITASVLDTGAVSFSATAGQLFSISDGLSGTIYSVNDISGIPSIEVLDTGLVKINQYGGNTVFGSSSAIQNASSVNSKVSIQSGSATSTALILRGFASSSVNLQEWQRSDGYLQAYINQYGSFYMGGNLQVGSIVAIGSGTRGTEKVFILNDAAANVGLIIKGAASQSASLQQWQNSSGTVLSSFSSAGRLAINTSSDAGGRALYVVQPNGGYGSVFEGTGTVPNVSIYAASGGVGLVVAGAASQSANLQEWQDNSSTILSRIRSDGMGLFPKVYGTRLFAGSEPGDWTTYSLYSYSSSASLITLGIQGNASQTADLTQWKNGSGTVLSKVDKDGNVNTTKSFVQTGTIGTTYAIDASGNQATYAANATVDFPNFSGMILIDCQLDGALSLWLCGGGSATRIGGSKTGGYDGTVAHNSGISGYTWTNANISQNVNITAIRTRSSA